jgi:hypothetical protein
MSFLGTSTVSSCKNSLDALAVCLNVLKCLKWEQNGTEFISFTLNKDTKYKPSDIDHPV